jgi:hypothetical protein
LDDQLTLSSPKHHAWLTPQQFGAQFGATDADIQATTSWLSAKGFHGIKVGSGRTTIQFSGTAAEVRDAFHTEIHRYVVNGAERFANSSDPQIPAALAPVVAGVVSLHNFPKLAHSHKLGNFRRPASGGPIEPLFSFAGCGSGSNQCNGLGPADLAKIYNVPSNLDGTGQTIAVVGQTNINLADAQQYRAIFGLPVNDPVIVLNGPDPGILASDESEADLDVQVSGAMAPKATIKLVISEGTSTAATAGIDLSALYIIDNNIAGVMSESYGSCEAGLGTTGNAFYNALWEQAAAQGITVLVSSGDNGSAACDDPNASDFAINGLAVSGLASTPFNMAVGGTDFLYTTSNPFSTYWNVTNSGTPPTESAKSYVPETTWSNSCAAAGATACTASIINANSTRGSDLVAGSGGPSSIYAKPAWQAGINGMPNDSKRDIPDVSLFSSNGTNNSFYVLCQKDFTGANSCDLNSPFTDFTGAGGTSASVQAFAGIMALINQSQASGSNPAPRQGNANYIFYKLYKQNQANAAKICASNPAAVSAAGCIFYDVTSGNISVACQGGKPNCSNTSTAANQYGVMVNTGIPAWAATIGYDLATGLGTVNIANLASAWAGVGLTASTANITASPGGTIAHGANASFTVNVASSGGTPTGQVSLIATPTGSAQTAIGPFSLSVGSAAISTDMLPGGTAYNVVAHYSGDGTFAQSDSAPVLVTVSKESSKTLVALVTFDPATNNIVSTNATTAAYGSPYITRIDVTNASSTMCSANLNSGSIPPIDTIPCPTGNVSVTDNGSPLNDFTISNTGVTSNVAPLNRHGFLEDQPIQLPAGPHSVVAAYAGDNSYISSSSAPDVISITKAGTAVAMSPIPNASANSPIALTATVNSGSSGVGPTGTITFTSTGSTVGTAPVAGTPANLTTGIAATGTATFAATFSTTGIKNVTATYSGDSNYSPAGPSAAISVNVVSSGSFNVTAAPVTVTAGSSAVSTITVTPSGGFTGSVQVSCSGTGLPPGVTCTPIPLTIAVTGAAPATGALTVLVAAPSSTLSASRNSPQQYPLYAAVNSMPPSSSDSGARSTWRTLSAVSGIGTVLVLLFPALRGRKQFRAALGLAVFWALSFTLGCGGGSSGGGGGGGTQNASHTTITVTNAKQASTSNNFAFNVAVTGANPAGQVQLFDAGTALGLPVTLSNGTAFINTGLATIGTHAVSAHYLGDTTNLPSASGALNLTVTGTTTLPLTATPSSSGSIALTIQ